MAADLERGRLDLMPLALLASGPGHGYGLIGELRRRSGGFLELPEASLYPALHRLEQAGLIAGRSANTQGRGRRVYRSTPVGKAVFSRQELVSAGVRTLFDGRVPYDPVDDDQQFIYGIRAEFSAFERKLIARRMVSGKIRAVREGFYIGGGLPFGTTLEATGTPGRGHH